jgi:hypothetical protein
MLKGQERGEVYPDMTGRVFAAAMPDKSKMAY